jgi:antitoxin (DNA-binding transcriptional repressor) of toxin-antitoxin stability system
MLEIDVTDASITLDQLLNEVEHGNEITIIRYGQPVARLSPMLRTLREAKLPRRPLSSRHPLRTLQSQTATSTLETLQTLRQEARY